MSTAAKPQTLDAWRELFDRATPLLPGDGAARRAQLQHFLGEGFPTKRQEDWKYTDLSGLAKIPYVAAVSDAAPEFPRINDTQRLLFVNGRCTEGDTRLHGPGSIPDPSSAADSDSVTALNAALAADGLNLHLKSGQALPRPLHVLSYRSNDTKPSTSHLRHRIVLEDNAEADVILESRGDGQYFGTDALDITLGAGAKLKLYRIQDVAAGATELGNTRADIGRDAGLETFSLDIGYGLARHDLTIALNDKGADATLHALSVADQRAHVDNHVRIEHRAPHARSRITFRGIASGRSRLIFDGLIVVAKGAVKTDSDQRLATLLLSSKAEVNVKPELEIYNDDVRCNHGAATGQLDPHALFYLRSRGIDEAAARELLTLAFVSTILDNVPLASLRDAVRERLTLHLQRLLADAATQDANPGNAP